MSAKSKLVNDKVPDKLTRQDTVKDKLNRQDKLANELNRPDKMQDELNRQDELAKDNSVNEIEAKINEITGDVLSRAGELTLRMLGLERRPNIAIQQMVIDNAPTINKAMADPDVKKEVDEAISHIGVVANQIADELHEPMDKIADTIASEIPKIVTSITTLPVKIGVSLIGDIPGVGAIQSLGVMLNNIAHTGKIITDAGYSIAETVNESKKRIQDTLDLLQ